MDIVGKKVKHSAFGIGTVTSINNDHITVAFDVGNKTFIYPSVFEKFLVATDDSVNAAIKQEIIAVQNAKIEVVRLEHEAAVKSQSEVELAAQDQMHQTVTTRKTMSEGPKHSINLQRIPGKPSTFYVFQGNTFDRESRSGYIWAPIYNAAGNKCHHWERLLDVREGDIIFHGCDGKIMAMSLAKDKCYGSAQPDELLREEMWDKKGRRIDCDYIIIRNPIETASFRDDILIYSSAKYSPFDKDGSGNMGYLYDLNRTLAKVFVNGMLNSNSYLLDFVFIKELLEE